MMRPLHLEELDALVACATFSLIENENRMLMVGEVFLEINRLVINSTAWIFEALLELRHVKNIVHLGELFWKFQPVGKFSTSCKNLERTNVSWSQLALDTEALCASHGSDTKIRQITRRIDHVPVRAIIIAFLT